METLFLTFGRDGSWSLSADAVDAVPLTAGNDPASATRALVSHGVAPATAAALTSLASARPGLAHPVHPGSGDWHNYRPMDWQVLSDLGARVEVTF